MISKHKTRPIRDLQSIQSEIYITDLKFSCHLSFPIKINCYYAETEIESNTIQLFVLDNLKLIKSIVS